MPLFSLRLSPVWVCLLIPVPMLALASLLFAPWGLMANGCDDPLFLQSCALVLLDSSFLALTVGGFYLYLRRRLSWGQLSLISLILAVFLWLYVLLAAPDFLLPTYEMQNAEEYNAL